MKKIVDVQTLLKFMEDAAEHCPCEKSMFNIKYYKIREFIEKCPDYVEVQPKSHKKHSGKHEEWHGKFKDVYATFLGIRKLTIKKWTGTEAKALNDIIDAILMRTDNDYEKALSAWVIILVNWERLNDFIKDQIQITAINKYLDEIILKISRHATKSTNEGLGKWA
jgi:hypothetical protein